MLLPISLSLSHHLSFSPMSMLSPHTSITVQKWFKHLSYQMSSRYFAPQSERKTRNEKLRGNHFIAKYSQQQEQKKLNAEMRGRDTRAFSLSPLGILIVWCFYIFRYRNFTGWEILSTMNISIEWINSCKINTINVYTYHSPNGGEGTNNIENHGVIQMKFACGR